MVANELQSGCVYDSAMTAPSAPLEFRVLGPIEVVGDVGAVGLGGPQQRRILAALLSDPGKVLTFDRMVQVLWPDGDEPANARRSAMTYVSRLRSALGDGVIETTDVGYVIARAALNVDADRFAALLDQARTLPPSRAVDVFDEALGLWRGPVFGDLNDEWWARPMVNRLGEARLSAMAERVDAMSANGWDSRAIGEATSLVEAYPLREQFVERAMRGLHSVGQTANALRTFQHHRTQLAEQTGLEPSAALVDLERSMISGAGVEPSAVDIARPLRGYVLHELLGEGSFGAVYRATQPGVERDVAVKVIRPDLADDRSFVHRFEAEAQLVARLEHPHIVPLYDFWRQPGGAFLVFRLMRGGSAEELLNKRGSFSITQASAVLDQIGGALSAAHATGVVHRDVKPANILFDDAGLAYLADFGIAATPGQQDPSVRSPDAQMPQRWSAGSALYASPEQLRDGVEDAKADQYALAVTIWELLSGQTPFGGRDPSAVMTTKLHEPLGRLDNVRSDIPTAIAVALTRAGAVHPNDRYPDVADFLAAWHKARDSAVVGVTDPGLTGAHDGGEPASTRVKAATMLDDGRPVANPYKGLRPFREGDAGDFHGRGALVDRLVAATRASPFIAVVGPSGSGKSSLALAGLVPRLKAVGSLVVVFTPSDSPLNSFADALENIASVEHAGLLAPGVIRRPGGLRRAIETIAGNDELVVVIDQLEELWTLASDEQRERFLVELVGPIKSGHVRVVATIRADFFDRPLADAVLGPLVSTNTFGVTPMAPDDLHEAITLPAEHIGVRFEPALISRLVAEASHEPGSLPLLQFALAELFEGRSGAVITTESYDALGGLAGSLSRQADEILHGFGRDDRTAVRRLFARLVTPGEGNEDTRRRVITSDLANVPEHVVSAFVNRRLLTSDRDRATRQPTIEVAHEVLLRSWPRLRTWLAEDRSWLRELRGLSSAATQWDAGGNDEADLYRGARLGVVSEFVTAHPDALTAVEQRFLAASKDDHEAQARDAEIRLAEQTRQNQRLRRSLIGIAAVLVVALGAGTIAVVQRQRANERGAEAQKQSALATDRGAEADRQRSLAEDKQAAAVAAAADAKAANSASQLTTLAGQSLAARSSQRDLAALLAVEAWRRSPNVASKSALFGTFTHDPGFLGYIRRPGNVRLFGQPIPGTTEMLITDVSEKTEEPGLIHRIDVVTGKEGIALEPLVDGHLWDIWISPSADGKFAVELVIPKVDEQHPVAAVLDLETGKRIGALVTIPDRWYAIAVNEAGTQFVAASKENGEAAVYDSQSGAELLRIPTLPGAPVSNHGEAGQVAYGPDGRIYVGSVGNRLRIFDPETLRQVQEIAVPLYSTSGLLRFSPDGTTLIARGEFVLNPATDRPVGSLARIDLPTSTTIWDVNGANYGYGECSSLAVSWDTSRLWCGNFDGVIRERSTTDGGRTGRTIESQKGWVTRLELVDTTTGTLLVSVHNNDGVIGRWGVDGAGPIQQRVVPGYRILAIFAHGTKWLIGKPNGGQAPFDLDIIVWDVASGSAQANAPTFLFGGANANLVTGVLPDLSLATFDVTTAKITSFPYPLNPLPQTSATSRDHSVILIGYGQGDGRAVVLDATTGKERLKVKIDRPEFTPGVSRLAITDDLSRLYVAGNGLWVFDVATGRELANNTDLGLLGVALSSDGTVVATRLDGTLSIYDPETLVKTGSLPGARGGVSDVLFSDDGTLMIANSSDGTVSLYDVASRTRLGDAIQQDDASGGGARISLSGDGLTASIPHRTGSAVLWDLNPERWAAAACTQAGRNLTREEWATYLGSVGEYRATCAEFPSA